MLSRMKTITLGSIIRDELPETWDEPYEIYVIREGDTVFYVGKSKDCVIDRILGHLGEGTWGWSSGDELGDFIKFYEPGSHNWQVDLMTIKDCFPFIKKSHPDAKKARCTVADAESAMISHYGPCLNKMLNRNRRPSPEKYTRYQKEVFKLLEGEAKKIGWVPSTRGADSKKEGAS